MNEFTQLWMRDKSDELAVENNCYFDTSRGAFTVWWIERYLKLYEGSQAGEPVLLRAGCEDLFDFEYPIMLPWDQGGEELSIKRARIYEQWIKNGGQPDWQYEITMRLFGWAYPDKEIGRDVRRFRQASIWVCKKNKKALALDTKIPTPLGWSTVAEIKIGDTLFDVNGKQCKVIDKTETYFNRDCYRVNFSNGESVVCDAGHLWVTSSLLNVSVKKQNKKVISRSRPFEVRTTEEIFSTQKNSQGSCVHTIKMPNPLECSDAELPIDPYVLGFWLGDGDSDGARITFAESDRLETARILARAGVTVRPHGVGKTETTRRAGIGNRWSDLRSRLRKLDVLKNKHIPIQYLRASVKQRIGLLQGLMDTDGCATKSGQLVFATSREVLRRDVCELLATLGLKFSCVWYEKNRYWRITFTCFREQFDCFRMQRKLDRQLIAGTRKWNRSRTNQIVSVEKVDSVAVQCIAIDSPTKEFLFGDTMIPTHNTPTLAAWGVYLTCADGEPGAKNFGCAKDGNQANIAMEHAMNMIDTSPELSLECKVNKNENSIYHIPTKSKYKPLSSAGENNQTSKEGLNGNLLVDECHVVDRAFMSRVSRAGISREEFLHIEVSTAGNNPDGYGKERQDYARLVKDGIAKDWRLMTAIYEAPQTISDKELDAEPIKFGRMANPAWGHTIRESEYLDDYQKSKQSPAKLAEFKMYRLNIWSNVSNQWLVLDKWMDCQEDFDIEMLKGKRASIGMDLSKTRDMSALGISVPIGDLTYLFERMWMTEAYIEQYKTKCDFNQWIRTGELIMIPGETIKQELIRNEFEKLCTQLDVQVLVYDKTYAQEFTDWVEEKYKRITQVEYSQTSATMEKPIDDFEAAVTDRQIIHDGNGCMNWQIGHCSVKEGFRGNRILAKPNRNDYRKIDGVVASVMSYWGTKHLPKTNSVYRRRGVLTA